MLLSFTFSNFRSFQDATELTLAAGKTKKHPTHIAEVQNMQVLKYGAIYGANAGGKTSLIDAMSASQFCIITSQIERITDKWCRSDDDNRTKPTSFEYLFETDGRVFQYGFDAILSESKITSEWIYEISNNLSSETKIFSRELNGKTYSCDFSYFSPESRERLEVYADDLSDKYGILFLTEMRSKKLKQEHDTFVFRLISDWFIKKLRINGKGYAENDAELDEAVKRLSTYDTGISSARYQIVENPPELPDIERLFEGSNRTVYGSGGLKIEKDGDALKFYEVKTRHGSSDTDFRFNEESSGTREAYDRVLTLFASDDRDVTFVSDDFGHSMHPLLAKKMVEDFMRFNDDRNNQLILATHHTVIMTMDIFRRDEIYFVERNEGQSSLYSLEQYDERFDSVLSKRYLEGRFGALPVFRENPASGLRFAR